MYLVTGGGGFIGSNLVHALLRKGERVRVLDNFSTGRRSNLDGAVGSVELIEGDIRDLEVCRKAMSGVRFVLHQAAVPSVPRSIQDPVTSTTVNIQGTLHILMAARDAGVARVVFASSSSVYGDTPTLPKTESMMPAPQSPYAVTKLTGEHLCRVFAHTHGLSTVALRYFNVYGPRQDPTSTYAAVVPRFITSCLKDQEAVIFGDGTQSRDFTFIEDCVEANLLACAAKNAAGDVCNIGSGARVTVADLHALVRQLAGRGHPPRLEASRPGDVKHSLADIGRAATLLGYRPQHAIEDGLSKTLAWFTTHG